MMLTSEQKMIAVTRMPARSERRIDGLVDRWIGRVPNAESAADSPAVARKLWPGRGPQLRNVVRFTFISLDAHHDPRGLHRFGGGWGSGKEFAAADPIDFDELAGIGIRGGIIIEATGNRGALIHGELTVLA